MTGLLLVLRLALRAKIGGSSCRIRFFAGGCDGDTEVAEAAEVAAAAVMAVLLFRFACPSRCEPEACDGRGGGEGSVAGAGRPGDNWAMGLSRSDNECGVMGGG
jgi:hypothetical protein